jgi:nitroreductase
MEVLEAMKTRRSIRHYKPDPVDDKTLETVMEAARWAPSWGNTQCWRFVVVRDSSIKTEMANTLIETVEKPDGTIYNPSFRAITQAPVVIVVCAKLGRSGFKAGNVPVTDKGDWYMFDVALAMQNLALAAHALGLGTVHVGAFDAEKATKILNVPEGFCVVEMMPLGFPEREGKAPPRKELSEIVYHEKFGQ